jgi:hypothetical protein
MKMTTTTSVLLITASLSAMAPMLHAADKPKPEYPMPPLVMRAHEMTLAATSLFD